MKSYYEAEFGQNLKVTDDENWPHYNLFSMNWSIKDDEALKFYCK